MEGSQQAKIENYVSFIQLRIGSMSSVGSFGGIINRQRTGSRRAMLVIVIVVLQILTEVGGEGHKWEGHSSAVFMNGATACLRWSYYYYDYHCY